MIEPCINAVALAIVAALCLVRIKELEQRVPTCASVGYATLFAFAIGSALEWFWPDEVRAFHVDTGLNVGLGLVAISMVREELRALIFGDAPTAPIDEARLQLRAYSAAEALAAVTNHTEAAEELARLQRVAVDELKAVKAAIDDYVAANPPRPGLVGRVRAFFAERARATKERADAARARAMVCANCGKHAIFHGRIGSECPEQATRFAEGRP